MPAYRIRLNDIDAAGVVFAARICAIAHECYEDDLALAGLPLDRVLAEQQFILPLTRLEADFRLPLRHGEVVRAQYVVELAEDRYVVRIRLVRVTDGRIAAEIAQHHRCLSPQRTNVALPAVVAAALTQLAGLPAAAP